MSTAVYFPSKRWLAGGSGAGRLKDLNTAIVLAAEANVMRMMGST